ncbi:MAG: type II toxin-antitoxin system VapC family toxin [Rhizobiaceae bacterium]|nr:type II toxin-antitoxin system VapC family toxin [Rhizobiaceae bacterium]
MVVLDSSALIAFFREEPGSDLIESHIAEASVSAVNVQEVAKKMMDAGASEGDIRASIDKLQLMICPHEAEDAFLAASLSAATRQHGSGLGDRSCMALAMRLGVPALTTDRAWAKLDIKGLEVIVAR